MDASRTLRASLRRLGEPAEIAWRRRGVRPSRVVLLIDVSGSMSGYADPLLRLAHRFTQVGREHPNPEKIPHMAPSTPGNGQTPTAGDLKAGSPSKEGGTFLHRETSLNRETSASDFNDGAEPQTQQV